MQRKSIFPIFLCHDSDDFLFPSSPVRLQKFPFHSNYPPDLEIAPIWRVERNSKKFKEPGEEKFEEMCDIWDKFGEEQFQIGFKKGYEKGYEEGYEEGLELGRKEQVYAYHLEVAMLLMSFDCPLKSIMNITKFTEEELRQIASRHDFPYFPLS